MHLPQISVSDEPNTFLPASPIPYIALFLLHGAAASKAYCSLPLSIVTLGPAPFTSRAASTCG